MVQSCEMSNGGLQGDQGDVYNRNDNQGHAWTTNDIRKNSSNWTLAGDMGLLRNLQEFSHRLISRTHEMENLVDSLIHQSKEASAKVNNVINDFQMLANLQFVENRVYDEEIGDANADKKAESEPKTQEQKEAEMMTRVTQALKIGISVLDIAFDRIDVDETSDSDDDEPSEGRILLEPKDIYENRPLPFIIGTREFQEDEFAGLRNLLEEDLSQEISTPEENISASEESEDESDEDNEIQRKPASSTFRNAMQQPNEVDKLSESSEDSSDLFEDKNDENDEEYDLVSEEPKSVLTNQKPVETNQKLVEKKEKLSLIEELANKTKKRAVGMEAEGVDSVKSSTEKISPKTPKKESDDLFINGSDDGGDFFEDDDSPFRKKTGLFSGKNLLSDETEDSFEGDLFQSMEIEKKKTKAVPPVTEKKEIVARKPSKSSLLLQDDDNEEEDLFGSFTTRSSSITSPQKASSKVSNKTSKSSSTSVGSSTSSVPALVPRKSTSLLDDRGASDSFFGEDSDDGDLFSKPIKTRKNSGFSFDDDGDLFRTVAPKVEKTKNEDTAKIKKSVAPKIETKSHSLFEDSDNFDLFKPGSLPQASKQKTDTKKDVKVETKKPVEKKPQLSNLEESDDFNLFSPVVKTKVESKTTLKEQPKTLKSSAEDDLLDVIKNVEILPVAVRNEETTASNFDSPMNNTNILNPINKDRIKIQAKRRKPTRKGRQALLPAEAEEVETVEPQKDDKLDNSNENLFSNRKEVQNIPESEHSTSVSDVRAKTSYKKEQQDKKSLMSQLMSEAAGSKIGKNKSSLGIQRASELDDDDDDDDLFSSAKKPAKLDRQTASLFQSTTTSESTEIQRKSNEETNSASKSLNSESPSDDELFSVPSFREFKNSNSEKNSIFGEDSDSDDIFKSPVNKDIASQGSGSLLDDNSDNIFAGLEKEKYEMFPTQLVDEEEDDDDIFSNLGKTSKSSNKAGTSVTQMKKKSSDIFKDPLGGFSED